jgi:hypothetical protein
MKNNGFNHETWDLMGYYWDSDDPLVIEHSLLENYPFSSI